MWTIQDAADNTTNKVTIPTDGLITISNPDSVRVLAYVNDAEDATHQVAVKAGDTVYFKLTNYKEGETPIGIMYDNVNHVIMLPGKPTGTLKGATDEVMGALNKQADQARKYYDKLAKQVKQIADNAKQSTLSTGDTNMAEVLNPSGMMMSGGGDGLFGGGGGGGLIGGLILGSLLRQGNGGLFGGNDGGAGAALRSPPEQVSANMALMQSIGQVDKAVAVSTAAMEASQATQTIGITGQLNSVTSSLANRVDGVKDTINMNNVALMQGQNTLLQTQMANTATINQNIMENRYELSKDISNDGEKTRALITQQYEINLQRQLADANAAIIELRGDNRLNERTRGIEVNTTTTVNQAQQQAQQQAQYGQLASMIYGLSQSIRDNNSAINVGSGTQTSTNTPTNTNIR